MGPRVTLTGFKSPAYWIFLGGAALLTAGMAFGVANLAAPAPELPQEPIAPRSEPVDINPNVGPKPLDTITPYKESVSGE